MKKQLIIFVIIIFFISGCVAVQPWEREYLADPIMSFEGNSDTSFHEEIQEIREASAMGKEGTGGGCGCN